MGTVASIHVHDDVPSEPTIDATVELAFAELERLEEMFSTFRPTSEISRVNAGTLDLLDCSPEVIDVLDACTWMEHASDGAFHVRRPDGRIDPAGFVKGWAAERAASKLTEAGLVHWSITVGGDMLVHGRPGRDESWTIGIADPLQPGQLIATVDLPTDDEPTCAIATSGTSERGEHLWDAADRSATGFASLTVIGPSLTWADAFATAAFAMGEPGLAWAAQFDGYRAFAVALDGTLVGE
jgi:thiamine biosynthesis lipoprotein